VSACSILLISANRHTSPYPVYPLGISYLKTYLERTISGIRVDTADCNLLTDEELAERIRTLAPRYIGVSLRNVDGANSLDRRGFLPEYKALYIRSFQRYLDLHPEIAARFHWQTGADMFRWWITRKGWEDSESGQLDIEEYLTGLVDGDDDEALF